MGAALATSSKRGYRGIDVRRRKFEDVTVQTSKAPPVRTGPLEDSATGRLQRIAITAAREFTVEFATVSLVDGDMQRIVAAFGVPPQEIPWRDALCARVIQSNEAVSVADALTDARFCESSWVLGPPHVRFYMSHPLRDSKGAAVGALCLANATPRKVDERHVALLSDLARWAEAELALCTLEKAREAIQGEEQFLALSVDLVAVAGFDGYFKRVSRSWTTALGYTEKELLGKPFFDLVHEDDRERTIAETASLAAGGQTLGFTNRYRHKNGSERWLQWTAAPAAGEQRIYAIARDVTERRNMEAALLRSEAHNRAVLEAAGDAIITIDETGIIETFNPAAERLLGFESAEAIGGSVSMVMPRAAREQHDIYLRDHGRTSISQIVGKNRNLDVVRRDGSTVPIWLAVTDVNVAGRRVFVGVLHDLTEQKRVTRLKDEFVSTVSHELRTPLTAIRGSLALMATGATGTLPAKTKALVDIAHRNCERLVRLVNDILVIEKIESATISMRFSLVQASLVARQAVENNRAFAEPFGVTLALGQLVENRTVLVDSDRLLQALTNLISNAVKFSPRGESVRVWTEVIEKGVRFGVEDRGPGIPKDFWPHIFEKFAQADSSTTRQSAGSGLGLSITKIIVERLGGTVGFASQAGVGTTFWIDLPHGDHSLWKEP